MLIQFRFKNFKSFRDDTILDLSATSISEHSDRVVSAGYEKLLPVAAIFGANASGKSNIIEAFRFMMTYVLESFSYGGDSEDKKIKKRKAKKTPFLFDVSSRNEESLFEVYYMDTEEHGYRSYNYGFVLGEDGVTEEWLNCKAKSARHYRRIFYRDTNELDLAGIPEKSRENLAIALEKETLLVSLGAKLKIAKLKGVRDWFYSANIADFGDPYENAFLSSVIPEGFADNKSVQDKVVEYFAAFDPSIVGFHVEKSKGDEEEGKYVKIDALHRLKGGETTSIPLQEESNGTLKMFALYPVLQDTLERGSILFADELNARLHPLLVRTFLITFLSPEINVNHAQIVFTTHDSWQLSTNLLRRDEIWFTEKDADGATTLYSLADFVDVNGARIRKDESYEKNYLLGKYGAIPTLKSFDMFREESDG
ncbi:MAG: ATP-binding protein [Lachnospiraceae bacterium]|nr:ATP-binding protein [Lachnospiraceae bacterium]